MGRFARNSARWLKEIFPPSQTSVTNPGAVSDDVQLVHPFAPSYQLAESFLEASASLSNPGVAAATANLFVTGPEELRRIRVIAVHDLTAPGTSSLMSFQLIDTRPGGTFVNLGVSINFAAGGTAGFGLPAFSGDQVLFLPPEHGLRVFQRSGAAAADFTFTLRVFGELVPIGTAIF